ncbi:Esterase PHB depolymerase [Roseovarius pacificus]|uniref:Esterase PHB depolymerase n=1 Tax=Roseovarius pacificus TaxID=337701 RepID=A0A1M7HXT3_9RHOB|nr:PHB depolymerase family esterase [Roseovarius pacificus]GGO61001.1 hypothetical protein GCM10011315_36720 [Roseovarius pacificus]SHM33326.1 Esterase PHB depolymerase [Roseovarius pacificus]
MSFIYKLIFMIGMAMFVYAGAAFLLRVENSAALDRPAASPASPAEFKERRALGFKIEKLARYEYAPSARVKRLAEVHVDGDRQWYSYAPKRSGALPIVILLHGAGRNGLSMIEMWQSTADRFGIVLVAPDSEAQSWTISPSSAAFLASLVDKAAAHHHIDRSRAYLFGHSAGAVYAQVLLNRFETPWQAAAIHGGYAPADELVEVYAETKPLRIYLGEADHLFSVEQARLTGQTMAARGHDTELVLIPDHTHWFYQAGPQIAEESYRWFRSVTP